MGETKSLYEDYDKVSQRYDEARVADGVDFMSKVIMSLLHKKPNEIKILEAGCGTGNYSLGFAQNGLQNLTLMDASQGMLQAAHRKLKDFESFVSFKQFFLPILPFDISSFDVVTFIQVFHHIDSPDKNKKDLTIDDYPNLHASLREAYRVLKPGGILLVDTMFNENIESFWWTSLCHKAAEKMKRLRIPKQDMLELLKDLNFTDLHLVTKPEGCLLKREIYDDISKISDPLWRSYLSQYRLVERSGELDDLIKIVEAKQKEGELESFRAELNQKFKIYGHHTTIFARKM